MSVVLFRASFTVSIRTMFSLPIVPSGPSSLCKKIKFPHISFSFSFHLLQIALHCVGAQHIFLGEWERESGALMEFAHFQNILSSDNFPFGSFGLIYKSASLMMTTTTTMMMMIIMMNAKCSNLPKRLVASIKHRLCTSS